MIVCVIVFAGGATLANTKIGELVLHQYPDISGRVPISKYCIMMAIVRHNIFNRMKV